MRFDGRSDSLGNLTALFSRTHDVAQVLFPAVACRAVRASHHIADDVTDVANRMAADQVAAPVVDLLEEIQIHHYGGDRRNPLSDRIELTPVELANRLLRERSHVNSCLCHLLKP